MHTKISATYALSSILNDDKCVLTLIDFLATSKNHEEVRGHAAEGIGMVPIPNKQLRGKVENVLIKGLNNPSPLVRFWSCYAVGQKKVKKAIPILENLVNSDTDICLGWWYISE